MTQGSHVASGAHDQSYDYSEQSRLILSSKTLSYSSFRMAEVSGANKDSGSSMEMKKEISLMNGIAIIIGIVVGSGIFVSPRGVLEESGSIGMSLIVWLGSGILSTIGALCYAELGTMIPKSGGDYAYIQEAFGPMPAFVVLWVALIIITPTSSAISALTFANYILGPVFPNCAPPENAVRLLAAVVICFLTFVNCYNVKWSTKVQDIFTCAKVLALVLIIIIGLIYFFTNPVKSLERPFENTNTDPGHIALAFYSGLFSFAGWNYLNFVTEELKDPYKNLPRAIYISLPSVTVIYVLANVAYFAVLTPNEILSSNAVAVTFGDRTLGMFSWIMPLSVAMSTFGGLNGNIFAAARLFFVGAREGHLPLGLAMINVNHLTPAPSTIFLCIVSLFYLTTTKVYVLINYVAFSEALFVASSAAAFIWLRIKRPDLPRPIRVNIIWPVLFLIVSVFLVLLPFYVNFTDTGVGVLITLTALPVYFLTIHIKTKPKIYKQAIDWTTKITQKVLLSVPTDYKL